MVDSILELHLNTSSQINLKGDREEAPRSIGVTWYDKEYIQIDTFEWNSKNNSLQISVFSLKQGKTAIKFYVQVDEKRFRENILKLSII